MKKALFLLAFISISMFTNQDVYARNPRFCYDVALIVNKGGLIVETIYNNAEILEFNYAIADEVSYLQRQLQLSPGLFYEALSDLGLIYIQSGQYVNAEGLAAIEFCGFSEDELLRDGRLNYRDAAARAVVYPTDSGYDVYEVDENSNGHYVFSITLDEITDAILQSLISQENIPIKTSPTGISSMHWIANSGCQLNYFSEDGHIREFLFPCGIDRYDEIYPRLHLRVFGTLPPEF